MEQRITGGPAFPSMMDVPGHAIQYQTGEIYQTSSQMTLTFPGMTLRDWFAGMAIGAGISDNVTFELAQRIAVGAYAIADAMLEARDK